ncbi:hypothetical protein NIES3585_21530 [Nodularia sp. NIES-3585]|nr:hypothetical protein NIES3585_21530 [Nodularia sp. NIES-3585]
MSICGVIPILYDSLRGVAMDALNYRKNVSLKRSRQRAGGIKLRFKPSYAVGFTRSVRAAHTTKDTKYTKKERNSAQLYTEMV